MSKPADKLIVQVEYFTGQEEGDIGHPYYAASCDPIGLVTDGETFEELLANLQEALAASLDGADTLAEYNVIPNPRVILHMDMPSPYAKIA